ncbi:MAG TPA: FtsQ-type POTRA domain-containing protein [Micromonosporaceae bacterium]
MRPDPSRTRGRGGSVRTGGSSGRARSAPRASATRRWRLVRARSDAVPPSVRRFMRRARQRRLRAALPWAVPAGLLALAAIGAWLVLGTGVFGVREVRVVGAQLLTPAQVREAAAVPEGSPLARVDLAAVGARIEALAPVDRVTVRRDWPSTLVVEVVERVGVAVVPQERQFAVVDHTGVVFRVVAEPPDGLPTLRVTSPGPDDAATRVGLTVLATLTPQLRERLIEVDVDAPARIRLLLDGGRTVVWGDASQGEAKARVATVLLDRESGVIDVSVPDVITIS